MPTHHLLTVWNPSYATDAMEAHLAILLGWAARHDKGDADDDDLYVWWGKVRSQNRQAPQANVDEIRAIGRAFEARDSAEASETHVYLTDYRSLYVGELLQVVEGDLDERERAARGAEPRRARGAGGSQDGNALEEPPARRGMHRRLRRAGEGDAEAVRVRSAPPRRRPARWLRQ